MTFWNIFKNTNKSPEYSNQLQENIKKKFPHDSENLHIQYACISGLFASIISADFEIHKNEQDEIVKSLIQWLQINESKAKAIAEIALKNIKELSSMENYLYTDHLSKIMEESERYKLLESLFQLSASDKEVSSVEEEEIRTICKGLLLEHTHFISARANVIQYLGNL